MAALIKAAAFFIGQFPVEVCVQSSATISQREIARQRQRQRLEVSRVCASCTK